MIINYKVKNFYSIGPEGAEINFAVDGNAPKSNLYISNPVSARQTSLIEVVIGPNASGKTKLLQGLAFLKHFLIESYENNPEAGILFAPHSLHNGEDSHIEVSFVVSGRQFQYTLTFNKERVLEEILYEFSKVTERTTKKTLASRVWDANKNGYLFSAKMLGLTDHGELRQNASMLSSAMRKGDPTELAQILNRYWKNSVITHGLWMMGNREDTASGAMLLNSLNFLHTQDNKELLKKAVEILREYDLGFSNFEPRHDTMPDGSDVTYYFIKHRYSQEFFTGIYDESSGTQKIIKVLYVALQALSAPDGGVAVIDELDAFLHPDIVEKIINLFLDESSNPNRAQILCTTHDHRILNILDKQQIIITEKDPGGGCTESWRLDEMNGVSTEENYYTKYMAGAYGGRPHFKEETA